MSVKSKTIPFSIESWNKLKGVSEAITKGGSTVDQLTLFHAGSNQAYPLVGVVDDVVEAWTPKGEYWEGEDSPKDLLLKVNVEMPFCWDAYSSNKDLLDVLDSEGKRVGSIDFIDIPTSYPLKTEMIWYEINGKCCIDSLPYLKTMVLKRHIHTLDITSEFKKGDRVRMISSRPKYGFGNVKVGDVGDVIEVASHLAIKVNFPSQEMWSASSEDLELVPSGGIIKHIIHYRKKLDNGICPLNGITFVGVEEGDKMLIYASVCSGDNFSKSKGVEIALSREPLGYTVVKGKDSLFYWIESRSGTLAKQTNKFPKYYNTLREEVLGMISKV